LRPIILPFGRVKIRPVRRPHAVIERKRFD
jgi:hypothetical protein